MCAVTQDALDELMRIDAFIRETNDTQASLLHDIESAILDSGRLTLAEWKALRESLRAIEELVPHIDLIVRLKERLH